VQTTSNAWTAIFGDKLNNALWVSGTAGTSADYSLLQGLDNGSTPTNISIQRDGGNLGLGTADAIRTLHIHNSSIPSIKFTNDSTGETVSDGFELRYFSHSAQLVNFENTPMRFLTNSIERLTIANDGNVGIGTDTPGSKLSIVGLPTSATGLSSGDVWRDGTTLKIVV
jgi:hypothetical protein